MDRILCLLISMGALITLYAYSGIPERHFKKTMFLYYTNISNLIVGVYFLLLFVYKQYDIVFLSFTDMSAVSFSVMMIIAVTFLVFHFILVPYGLKNREIIKQMNIKFTESIILHYIIPISTAVYWFLYSDKSFRGFIYGILWLGAPLLYFVFIMYRAKNGNIEGTKSKYPYPFLDIDRIGRRRCAGNIFALFVVFVALSAVMYYIK
ncbi:MAG: hypothetical protein E7218_00070 [Anaerofustis stercorihominis]|nr:hypothetical protein [Anaerofustis stercorihominis]